MSDIKFEEQFKIRATEINQDQKATLPAICNLLQEVAGNHAQQLEFDITDLQQNQLTWVLHRLCVKMNRYPDWREIITIQTWPSSGDGLRAYRDFLILDAEGNTIGKSLSYWLMMNTESRRPVRIPKEILKMAPKNTEHVLSVTDGNFAVVNQPKDSQLFQVRKTDLDLNKHVNNVRYVEWVLSCLPEDSQISEIDIKFLAESVLGDTDVAEMQPNGEGGFHHQIRRTADEKVLAKAFSS